MIDIKELEIKQKVWVITSYNNLQEMFIGHIQKEKEPNFLVLQAKSGITKIVDDLDDIFLTKEDATEALKFVIQVKINDLYESIDNLKNKLERLDA